MVEFLPSPDIPLPKPPTQYANHESRGAATSILTKVLWAHVGDRNPDQVNLTSLELVNESPGGAYRERMGSISSSGLMRGLSSETRASHSWISTA